MKFGAIDSGHHAAFLRRNSASLIGLLVLAVTAAYVWNMDRNAGGWTGYATLAIMWFCGLASGWLLSSIK